MSKDDKYRSNLIEAKCGKCGAVFAHRPDRTGAFCSKGCGTAKRNSENAKGRYKDGTGYWRVRAPENHPLAHSTGWILEHRLVMEQTLGRFLSKRERVHHRNGIRDDNRPENLELWTLDHKDPPGVRVSDVRRDSNWISGLLYC
jgi:hypothetical protein